MTMRTEPKPSPSRRDFIRLAGLAVSTFVWPGCAPSSPDPDAPGLPSLGGAPGSHEGQVVAAFCDTIVPGRHRDPERTPGALDVNAAALFFDPELPALALVPLLVAFLDGGARRLFGPDFDELRPTQRDAVVDDALAGFPPMEYAVQLAKLAYYTASEAQASLGYPGANPGYLTDPDFTFGVAVTRELTRDGNLD
jgi:hypothetical protein